MSKASDSNNPTIRVSSASTRVVRVGGRRMTLSVFKQLKLLSEEDFFDSFYNFFYEREGCRILGHINYFWKGCGERSAPNNTTSPKRLHLLVQVGESLYRVVYCEHPPDGIHLSTWSSAWIAVEDSVGQLFISV